MPFRIRYQRQPTVGVIAGAIIFVAALAIATIIVTSRDRSGVKAPVGAPGVWSAQTSGTNVTLLDVTFVEPPESDSLPWALLNVLISPPVGGSVGVTNGTAVLAGLRA